MRILVMAAILIEHNGLLAYHLTLLKFLRKMGIEPTLYCPFISKDIMDLFRKAGVPVFFDLEKISNNHFDLVQASQNIMAYIARAHFPNTPLVYVCHGHIYSIDHPPLHDLNIDKFVAVSDGLRKVLISRYGHVNKSFLVLPNPIDTDIFNTIGMTRNVSFKKVLFVPSILINKEQTRAVKEACHQLGLSLRILRQHERMDQSQLVRLIKSADIVIGRGRLVAESLLCHRSVILYDFRGGAGQVTIENYTSCAQAGFSDSVVEKKFSVEELKDGIRKCSSQGAIPLATRIGQELDPVMIAQQYGDLYQEAIKDFSYKELNSKEIKYIADLFLTTSRWPRTYQSDIFYWILKMGRSVIGFKENLQAFIGDY